MTTDSRRVTIRKVALRGLAAIGVVAALAGCSPEDRIYVRAEGENLVFKVCDQFDANDLVVGVSDGNSTDYAATWTATGKVLVTAGTEITYGTAPQGMSAGGAEPLDPVSENISFTMHGTVNGSYRTFIAVFLAGSIPEGVWRAQTTDAANQADPCA